MMGSDADNRMQRIADYVRKAQDVYGFDYDKAVLVAIATEISLALDDVAERVSV